MNDMAKAQPTAKPTAFVAETLLRTVRREGRTSLTAPEARELVMQKGLWVIERQ